MPHQIYTRIKVDKDYAELIGKAIYIFSYLEYSIANIINVFQPDFINEFNRGKNPMTAGDLSKKFNKKIKEINNLSSTVTKNNLSELAGLFENLVIERNALIHAHPATDLDGSQILIYQSNTKKPIHDMRWPRETVMKAIKEFDEAGCEAARVFELLRNSSAIK